MAEHQPTRHDMLDDMLVERVASTDNLFRSISATIRARTSILQDIANVSLAILGATITLAVLANSKIKTHLLFYFAEVGFLLCIILSFAIRVVILWVWNRTIWALRRREGKIRNAIGYYKWHSEEEYEDAVAKYKQVMSEKLEIPKATWPMYITTIALVISLFVLSIILLGLSLLFKISTK